MGVGEGVEVDVGVSTGAGVVVDVGVDVGVDVLVGVTVGVAVGLGVCVAVAVGSGVLVAVARAGSLANPNPQVLLGTVPRRCALFFRYPAICCGVYPGKRCLTSAARPATCGEA